MILHNDKALFINVFNTTAEALGIENPGIVEKDYYVTLFLKRISELQPGIVFKGGTALSKCHKAILRFSEDIDLSVETAADKLTQGQRKQLKTDIISIIEENGFTLINPEQVRSRRDFNRYVIDFHPARAYLPVKQNLIVETAVFIKSFPTIVMNASSYIYDFLKEKGSNAEIMQYGLEPFPLNVLSLERAFIDKVFALADYFLNGKAETHSRHLYDLYKLYPKVALNDSFKKLVAEVCQLRKSHLPYASAQDGVDVADLLRKMVAEKYYKNDYDSITQALLFECVPYERAVTVIDDILASGCFHPSNGGKGKSA